jgi:hypothetical protein
MAGCELVPTSAEPFAPGLSSEAVAGVTLALDADPATAAPGDTIRLTATAYNSTNQRIQIGSQCGPAMDVLITTPQGHQRSALHERHGPNVAFTCELGPYHFVEPKSTQVTRIEWVPGGSGEYVAAAGLRRADGLSNVSDPVRIRVR